MAARKKLEQVLDEIAAIGNGGGGDGARARLEEALADRNNFIVGAAARAAKKLQLSDLTNAMASAFLRFMELPNESDRHCEARTAVVDALNEFEHEDAAVYLKGIRHVQMEPVWGKRVDAAGELRGQCLIGLARSGDPDLLYHVLDALMDAEPQPRHAAVRVLRAVPGEECDLLLRMKVMSGDRDAAILAACFSALAGRDAPCHLEFIERYLPSEDSNVAEGAALAIGEMRSLEAFVILKRRFDQELELARKKALLLPMALTRQEAASRFLMEVLDDEHPSLAAGVLRAVHLFEGDESFQNGVRRIVEKRDHEVLNRIYAEEMGRG